MAALAGATPPVARATERRRHGLSRLLLAGLAALAFSACGGKSRDLSTEQLSRAVDAQRGSLKQCYDAALKKYPYTAEMRMQAVLRIAPSGRVRRVELEGGSGLPGMSECVRSRIEHWRFPEAQDETATSLPLIFHPDVVEQKPDLPTLDDLLKSAGNAGSK